MQNNYTGSQSYALTQPGGVTGLSRESFLSTTQKCPTLQACPSCVWSGHEE